MRVCVTNKSISSEYEYTRVQLLVYDTCPNELLRNMWTSIMQVLFIKAYTCEISDIVDMRNAAKTNEDSYIGINIFSAC